MTDLEVRPAPEDVERSWRRGTIPRGSAAWLARWRPVDEPVGWQVDAGCRPELHGGVSLTNLFFSDHPALIRQAKAICADCPVKDICLRVHGAEPEGTWGGQTVQERFLSVTDPDA